MKYKTEIKFLTFIIAIILLWYWGRFFQLDTQGLEGFLAKTSFIYSGAIFIILYVIVTFFIWFSKDIFRIIGALVFGALGSTLLVLIAETLNACILFFIARSLGRGFVENSLGPRYGRLDEKISRSNFIWLFILRAAPLVPFRFLDLAAGLTKIPFKKYLLAVIFGSLPRIFWLQFILAGVGRGIITRPWSTVEYFLDNKIILMFSFFYLILVIFTAMKFKKGR